LHTNGYSLARKVFAGEIENGEVSKHNSSLKESLADALLKPHRCYLDIVKPFLQEKSLHAMAHITGGGLIDNVSRVLPKGLRADVDWQAWPQLPIFQLLASRGNIDENEMQRVFNLGIGFVLVVNREGEASISSRLHLNGEQVYRIGQVVA
jgi:phosphoribosylformylglycinamidine cyclo-ligase